MNCPLCKATMSPGTTILPYEQQNGDHVIVILNVPALVCEQCGEEFIEGPVALKTEEIFRSAEHDGVAMGFVSFKQAA